MKSDALVHVDVNEVFNATPIRLPGFELRGRSVHVVGKPTIRQWQGAMSFASAAHESSAYWVGSLVAYAEDRAEWKDKLDQAMTVTGLSRGRLTNLGWMVRKVEEPERQIAQSPEHASVVAPLSRVDQTKWLERSRTEDWSASELRGRVKAGKSTKVLSGQAETIHQIDVTVSVSVEATDEATAEKLAWEAVKLALLYRKTDTSKVTAAKVIAAHARPR
jgi:hypothetical protein